MSITPVDKPPDGDDNSEDARSRGPASLREYFSRFVSWLVERAPVVHRPERARDGTPRDEASIRAREERVRAVDVNDERSFAGFPERERPLVYPARDLPGINTPDVVCVETECGLRLSVPENPDATLTSDVWTTVDP